MTELEKIAYAKSFIDKLAGGINPLDDSPIPDGDLCNQVRISRCFFYVSDVLRQVIEKGSAAPSPVPTAPAARQKRPERAPFALTPEEASAFPFSERPIGITELTKRINSLIDPEAMRPIRYRSIVMWLMSIGMLEGADGRYGSATRAPSEEGMRIGIAIEQREGLNGTFYSITYNTEAQAFILDNIAAAAQFQGDR